MIAISSHKPHAKSTEYRTNQIRAHKSWEQVFDEIYYFGEEEPDLYGSTTYFNRIDGDWPSIREMAQFAGRRRDWVAILNADIVVTPKIHAVVRMCDRRGLGAAVSKRWQFVPTEPMDKADVTDKGLDIFLARPWMWQIIGRNIPEGYRIGHCEWDTYVLGELMRLSHRKTADFTASKCVFHPYHEGRERPLNGSVPKLPEYLPPFAQMPNMKVKV